MKYVMMIYQGTTPLPGSDAWQALSDAERRKIHEDYTEIHAAPGVSPGLPMGLPSAAKSVQVRNGTAEVKDGPYLAECAGGFFVLESESMEDAIALAARVPAARLGGAVEIHPAEQYW